MNEETPPEDLLRYDVLTQEALRSVVKKVLDEVAVAGLPGDHHFFISFNTNHSGVRLSKRMREQYPEAMTIVIQHSFWNLETSDTGFEIDLTFNEIAERLKIPFAAIISFFDPSVKFGLQFDEPEAESEKQEDNRPKLAAVKDEPDEAIKEKPATKPKSAKSKSETKVDAKATKAKKAETSKGDETGDDATSEDGSSAEVVSLDAFRKK